LDSDDADPFTQELVGWMDGLKEHIKQEWKLNRNKLQLRT
jgi:hypothetical protein